MGMTDKEQRWREVTAKVLQITDKLGQKVDEGIVEAVVALNALGIATFMSCEGHLDHGIAAPWADFDTKEGETSKTRTADQQLMMFLELFYQDRYVPYDCYLTLNIRGHGKGKGRLQSQGAVFQAILPEDLRQQRLRAYQEEMQTFTAFLKEQYFSSTNE